MDNGRCGDEHCVYPCKKDDGGSTLPPIGGFNSSSDVASANLVAFWPFEGNFTETKQNLTGTNNGAGLSR